MRIIIIISPWLRHKLFHIVESICETFWQQLEESLNNLSFLYFMDKGLHHGRYVNVTLISRTSIYGRTTTNPVLTLPRSSEVEYIPPPGLFQPQSTILASLSFLEVLTGNSFDLNKKQERVEYISTLAASFL